LQVQGIRAAFRVDDLVAQQHHLWLLVAATSHALPPGNGAVLLLLVELVEKEQDRGDGQVGGRSNERSAPRAASRVRAVRRMHSVFWKEFVGYVQPHGERPSLRVLH
jgi:hypothetical protein